jgi:hypothetical protein
MTKKLEKLIPKIIEATTREAAVNVLLETLENLYLSTSYTEMVRLRDRLEHYQDRFKTEISGLSGDAIIEYEELNNVRLTLSFLYREIQDELSAPINSNKIYYEEVKTARRAEGLEELLDSETAEKFKAKSASALRDIVGASKSYKEYASEYAIAYGNYKTLESLLNSIRLTLDSIASREKRELIILSKDVK